MKNSKKLSKLERFIIASLLVGNFFSIHSAWATNYGNYDSTTKTITITGESGSNNYSKTNYVGVDGKYNLGDLGIAVSKIQTSTGGLGYDVYGIKITSAWSVIATSITDGIDVKSTTGLAYGIYAVGSGVDIAGLGSIKADAFSGAYGIFVSAGTNNISFAGTGSSIEANTAGGNSYGISFGSDGAAATGTTTISGLGSIVSDPMPTKGNAYGIYACNGNTDDKKFSVSFDSTNGGSISVYSATGENYGIKFDKNTSGTTGTSEVLNVNKIVAGVATTGGSISSGVAYGIQALAGENTIAFTGTDSFITAKTSTNYVYGISFGKYDTPATGTTIVTGLDKITAEGGKYGRSGHLCGEWQHRQFSKILRYF